MREKMVLQISPIASERQPNGESHGNENKNDVGSYAMLSDAIRSLPPTMFIGQAEVDHSRNRGNNVKDAANEQIDGQGDPDRRAHWTHHDAEPRQYAQRQADEQGNGPYDP